MGSGSGSGSPASVVTGAVIIQTDSETEEYNLLAPNGDEGEVSSWGVPAVLVSGGLIYLAYRDEDGEPDVEIGPAVCLLTPIATEETEVEFEGGEDEGEDTDETAGVSASEGMDEDEDDDTDDGEAA